jgi:hypothetical protein
MALPGLINCRWKVNNLDVSWPEQTVNGVRQRRRQLSATLSTEVDPYAIALFTLYFNASAAYTIDQRAYIGDGSTGGVVHPVVFVGTWQRTNIHTYFDGGMARLSMDIWQCATAWETVPTV